MICLKILSSLASSQGKIELKMFCSIAHPRGIILQSTVLKVCDDRVIVTSFGTSFVAVHNTFYTSFLQVCYLNQNYAANSAYILWHQNQSLQFLHTH